jgi:lipopolysaccharide transport system ATP-binding protein
MRILREKPQELCREAERFAGIGAAFDEPMATYSSGMQARVLFAAAFAGSTPYILLDEILSVGDAAFTAKCWRLINQKLSQGMSGFLVTHDWSSVLRLCSHCIWLDRGQVHLHGSPQKVVSSYLNQGVGGKQLILDSLCMTEYAYDASIARLTLVFSFSRVSDEPLQAAVSIEDIGQGRGWQIIALTDFQPLSSVNQNSVVVQLEPLPLITGDYEACLFIKASNPTIDLSYAYSWYTGTSFPIRVDGLSAFLGSKELKAQS